MRDNILQWSGEIKQAAATLAHISLVGDYTFTEIQTIKSLCNSISCTAQSIKENIEEKEV